MIKELLASKKFLAALIAIVVWVGGYAGLDLSFEDVAPVVGVIIAYILGQGFADTGKEAAKERTKNPEPPVPIVVVDTSPPPPTGVG
jgi:hypothetical protein